MPIFTGKQVTPISSRVIIGKYSLARAGLARTKHAKTITHLRRNPKKHQPYDELPQNFTSTTPPSKSKTKLNKMMHNLPGGSTSTAASAPGKVLLAGGYLVLDRAYTGLTFGLDARIHAVVREWEAPGNGRDGEGEGAERSLVEVRSPQFEDAVWRYGIGMLGEGGGVEVAERGDW